MVFDSSSSIQSGRVGILLAEKRRVIAVRSTGIARIGIPPNLDSIRVNIENARNRRCRPASI
jgi:hypothetical protein